jgi:hypothetical protein
VVSCPLTKRRTMTLARCSKQISSCEGPRGGCGGGRGGEESDSRRKLVNRLGQLNLHYDWAGNSKRPGGRRMGNEGGGGGGTLKMKKEKCILIVH